MAAGIPTRTDVAIIGGGIMGASLAWHLARLGAGQVTLFERGTVASGASGRTGALLRRHYSNRPEAMLVQASFHVYAAWPDIFGGPAVHTPTGLVVPIGTGDAHEENLGRLHRNVALQNELGINSRVITAEELRALDPYARVDDFTVAAYEPDSGYVDAVAATRGMALAATRAGVRVVEGCPVQAITHQGDRVTGVETAAGAVSAGTVVCAAGPWSPPLAATAGIRLPITALRVQVAVLHRPLDLDAPHLSYVDPTTGMFCRPWGAGRTLVGVSGGDQHDAVDPDAYEERNDVSYPARAIETISRRFPGMARAAYLHGHAGLYDMTPDVHPIIGAAGLDGLYVMAGFCGAGFKKGPAVGQALAELIVTGRPGLDLAPFSLDRFQSDSWRTPWSENEYLLGSNFGHGF